MRVDIEGVSGNKQRTETFGVMDQFANLVSAPLVTGALMVARGEIKGAGVVPAEAVISPSEFLPALAERGVRVARLQI
jgi:saccharopine dehydrogenase-like NADP-dependent oxidoreductase